jgi:hypothetical protein
MGQLFFYMVRNRMVEKVETMEDKTGIVVEIKCSMVAI